MKFSILEALNKLNIFDCLRLISKVCVGAFLIYQLKYNVTVQVIYRFNWVCTTVLTFLSNFFWEHPTKNSKMRFSKAQTAFWKEAERIQVVLLSRWVIMANPSQFWYSHDINEIVKAFAKYDFGVSRCTCEIWNNKHYHSILQLRSSKNLKLSNTSQRIQCGYIYARLRRQYRQYVPLW